MKRRAIKLAMLAGAVAAAQAPVWAQMHPVQKPETVVRAVGVWEWTGDEAKPTASRLVPVSVYIDQQLEDAGVYLARPVPFALQSGTVFELERSGVPEGTLELAYARHLETPDKPRIDDGWFAYGAYKPEKAPVLTSKKSGALPVVVASGGNKPHFGSTPAGNSSGTRTDAGGGSVDRSTAAGGGTTVSASPAPATDPSEPTMRRRTDSAASAGNSDSDSAKDDPERPTLRKRTPDQQKAAQKQKNTASVNGVGDLNDDPDRPSLHRGKPASRLDEQDLPPLTGLPGDMHQRVAVSDAKDRPEHDFRRAWESDAEHFEVLAKLQAMARAQLAQYGDAPGAPAVAPAPAPAPVPPATRTTAGRKKTPKPAPAPPPPPVLSDETLKAYTLSYGGAATYFYSAASPGSGGVPRYVTLVAQREPLGELKLALSSVTDAAHLDRTPQMRLVDVVDAEASNRASLLFELRGQTTRQFALYRVIGAEAEQVLVAGNTE